MSYYKNNNSKKFIAITICFVLIAIILCGMMTSWFQDWNPYCWFGHSYNEEGICTKCGAEQPAEVVKPENPDDEKPDEGEEPLENGGMVATVLPSKTNMCLGARRAAQTPAGENTYELTATITPADANLQTVTWAVAWKNASSTWATGKTATDYVTVTPNGLKATVTCLQAFGEQVVVTVTSVDNSSATASCNVDYVEKVLGLNFQTTTFASSEFGINYTFDTSVYTIKADLSMAIESQLRLKDAFYNILSSYYTGTDVVELDDTLDSFTSLHDYAALQLLDSGETLGISHCDSNGLIDGDPRDGLAMAFFDVTDYDHRSVDFSAYCNSIFRKAVEDSGSGAHATFDVSFTSSYNGQTYSSGTKTIEVRFDASNVYVAVSGVQLNSGSIIF